MFKSPYKSYDNKYEYWNDDSWNKEFNQDSSGSTDAFTFSALNNPAIKEKFSIQQIHEFDEALKFFSDVKNGQINENFE